MKIEILGTESLGVRGLCCVVHARDRHIVIDPGVALGYCRAGLKPHPIQVAAGEDVRHRIVEALKTATDVVFSHFHGDHVPLAKANPYQLSLGSVAHLLRAPRLWCKGPGGETPRIAERRDHVCALTEREAAPCQGHSHGLLGFSELMPHGPRHSHMGTVMMTRVEDGDDVFVHASDIQLLEDEPVERIVDWSPTVLLASGPPLYRMPVHGADQALARARTLAEAVPCCILDHHLLRSRDGVDILDMLRDETEGRVQCAADFMGRPRRFLEADRQALYARYPVDPDWHERYALGQASTEAYRNCEPGRG